MKTKIKITRPDAVVVKQTVEEITKSGIILTTEALSGGSMEQFEGTVLAIGAEVERVKTGDYVSFARHGFSIKRWKDEEYFFLLEEAIHTVESKVDEGVECEQNEFFI